MELEYLSGFRESVESHKVAPFLENLRSRSRVLSLTRTDLCNVLYDEDLSRLTDDRADAMKRFLRKFGLSFQPEEWGPRDRIQIWPDESFVPAELSEAEVKLSSLLPQWLEPHRLPPGSRDPLGFQSSAEKIANEFLPGLTVFTTRIGYYGFIAWAVETLNSLQLERETGCRECFHRLERALALCEFIHHGKDEDHCRLLGQRSKSQVLQSAQNDRFRIPERILKNQESAGALRLYSTSMVSNGFANMEPELAIDNRLPLELTELGQRLAREARKRVPGDFVNFALADKTKERSVLGEWGQDICFSGLKDVERYRDAFLEGFLLGGGRDAEARYQTVKLLFKRKRQFPRVGKIGQGGTALARSAGFRGAKESQPVLRQKLFDAAGGVS